CVGPTPAQTGALARVRAGCAVDRRSQLPVRRRHLSPVAMVPVAPVMPVASMPAMARTVPSIRMIVVSAATPIDLLHIGCRGRRSGHSLSDAGGSGVRRHGHEAERRRARHCGEPTLAYHAVAPSCFGAPGVPCATFAAVADQRGRPPL